MKRRTEIYSIFGQIDAVVAEEMAAEGKVRRIEQNMIPPTALFDDQGRKAVFAIVMPDEYAGEFMDRVEKLRW
jgi:alkylation response protein AidB-like acyl-CoA dehydrogenase